VKQGREASPIGDPADKALRITNRQGLGKGIGRRFVRRPVPGRSLLGPYLFRTVTKRLPYLKEQALAFAFIPVVALYRTLPPGQKLTTAEPLVPLPLTGRQDHRNEMDPLREQGLDFDILAIAGIEKCLTDQYQGNISGRKTLFDDLVPGIADRNLPIGPKLDTLLFQPAQVTK
jgi:hypothetical protein